eukprot:GHVS01034963.1.p1 GENE.GHVS01034963.1~~GHVS01034963.1.p1  ORF type:complete len:120 (+),score=15.25 GHVS01034963.1:205-564(+)
MYIITNMKQTTPVVVSNHTTYTITINHGTINVAYQRSQFVLCVPKCCGCGGGRCVCVWWWCKLGVCVDQKVKHLLLSPSNSTRVIKVSTVIKCTLRQKLAHIIIHEWICSSSVHVHMHE